MTKVNFHILLIMFSLSFYVNANDKIIWFAPTNTDLLNKMSNIRSWKDSSKEISQFKFYHGLIRNVPVPILIDKVRTLNALDIGVSLEMPILISPDSGGKYIEGFHNRTYIEFLMKKMKDADIKLSSVVFDEPIYYGFYKKEQSVTLSDINKLVENSKYNIGIIRKYYPNVRFHLIEPIQLYRGDDFLKAFSLYYASIVNQTGIHFDSVQDDIFWDRFNKDKLFNVANYLAIKKINLGLVINASNGADNDQEWVRSSNENLGKLISDGIFKLNNVYPIFQSWNSHPNNVLPETDPLTQTHSILLFNNAMNSEN